MGREKVLFSSEEKRTRSDVAAFLRALADKLDTGSVILQQGETSLTLDIPANLTLEVKAEEEDKRTKTKYSLEVELEWYPGEEGAGLTLG